MFILKKSLKAIIFAPFIVCLITANVVWSMLEAAVLRTVHSVLYLCGRKGIYQRKDRRFVAFVDRSMFEKANY